MFYLNSFRQGRSGRHLQSYVRRETPYLHNFQEKGKGTELC